MRPEPDDDRQAPPTPEEWAERRDGVFSHALARAAGLSAQQISRRRRSGRWRVLRRGVSAIAGAPPTRWQALRAVELTVPDDVCLSHESSAWVQGAPCPPDGLIHISGPMQRVVRLFGV